MRKLVLFAALLAILGAYGCNEDNVYNPDINTDGRVIGTIQGVVTDGADATLLAGIEVSTTVRGEHVTTVTDATGHYAFTNLDPGAYLLTFQEVAKGAGDPHTTMYGHAQIPTLEDLSGIMDVPTDADFPYEIEANMEMFPLVGTAQGYVYVQTDDQTMVPAAGCTVVADFLDPTVNTSHTWGTVQIADNEWTATTDEMGHYSFTGLPAGTYGEARTMSFSYDGMNYQPLTGWNLDLRGGDYVVDNFVFDEVSSFYLANQNWDNDVYFPPAGSFTGTFSKAVDPATFTAVLTQYGTILPTTVTWTDDMTFVVDPANELEPDTQYNLEIAAWSTDGNTYNSDWYIYTVGTVEPAVASTNFADSMTFPVDGNLEFNFNMPMDPASVVVTFNDKVGDIVFDATWNADNTMLTIDPDVDLDYHSGYNVTVEGNSANGMHLWDSFSFHTLQLQNVQVNDTNFADNFDNTADLWFVFSEAMDPASMDIGMEMYPSGTPVALEDPVWSDGNTKVTLNPVLDLDKGVQYRVTMDGMAAGGAMFEYDMHYKTAIGDNAFVVTTNVVDHEFPVDGNIEVRFNKPMDTETVEVAFSGVDDLYGTITWTDDMNMVFDPDPELLPYDPASPFAYTLDITGFAQDGGALAHDANNPIVFHTIGGIEATWDNIRQIDGSYDEFPVDSDIQIRFSLPVNLDAPGTDIVVERYFDAIADWVPVLIDAPALSEDGHLLTVTPHEILQKDTDYRIAYTVGSFLLGDTTSGVITFHTQVVPPEPVSPVAAFTLDPAWDGNYDSTNVTFSWVRDPNATFYYVYARPADAAKDDYLRLAEVPQAATDTITATVTLPAYYDTRSDDSIQTPFEGNPVMFRIAAYNSLGEGTVSDDIAVYDVTGPEGNFTGQDVSADDSATGDGADRIVTVDFAANEYLDVNTIPNVTITENDGADNDWGDPDYTPTAGDVTFEDMDGFTVIHVQVVVADGMNGAGDYVTIDGFKDTSGNDVPVDFDIVPYQLTDTTIPTGTFADPGVSADNSTGDTAVDFTLTFTATELLDETVTPVVAVLDGGISDVIPGPTGFTYSVVDGVSVVELDMSIPAFANVAEDTVAIFGLTDLAGNSMAVANAVPYVMVDTTAPGGEWTAQSASGQNDTAADVDIEVTFTASEYLDPTVTPTFEITDGGYTGVAVAGDLVGYVNDAVNERTDVTFTVTVPATYNAMDDVLSVNGLTDVYGNVQDVAITGVILDTTAPADPTGLAATPGTDSPASVALIWDANGEPDLGGYNVYRTDGVDTVTFFVAEPDTEYVDNDAALVLGTTYTYVVTAVDLADPANESGLSNAVTATPDDTTNPQPATDFTVNDDTTVGDVALNWTASTSADVAAYQLQVGTSSGASDVQFWTNIGSGTSFTLTPPDGDTQYFYQLRAVDGASNTSTPVEAAFTLNPSVTGSSGNAGFDNSASALPVNVDVVLNFSEPMDSSALSFTIVDAGAADVAQAPTPTWNATNDQLTLSFTVPAGEDWSLDTVTVTGLTDVAGNAITVDPAIVLAP